jgi:hypothetical protein
MIAVRRTGRFSQIVTVITVTMLLLAAVALVGCGGTKESPGGPSGTGAAEGAEALVAPANVKTEILGVMKTAGFAVSDPMYAFVNYASAAAKDTVVVTGSWTGGTGAATVSYSYAKFKNTGGKWALVEAR